MTKDAKQSILGMLGMPWARKAPPLALVPDPVPVPTPLMSKPNTWYITGTGLDTNGSSGRTTARLAFKNTMPTEITGGELIEMVPRVLFEKAITAIRDLGTVYDDPSCAELIHELGELP